MVWRTQKNFQDVEKEACKIFGEWVRNTIQIGVEKLEGSQRPTPYLTMTGTIPGIKSHPHLVLVHLLPFFNPIVSEATLSLFREKGESPFDVEKYNPQYAGMKKILIESLYFRTDKNLRKWIKSPTYVQNIQVQIAEICFLLATFIKFAPLLKGGMTMMSPNTEPEVIQSLNKLIDGLNEWTPNRIVEWQNDLLKEIDLLAK